MHGHGAEPMVQTSRPPSFLRRRLRRSGGVGALLACVLVPGPLVQDAASRHADAPRSTAGPADRMLFFSAWMTEQLERRPGEALELYRELWKDEALAASDMRPMALLRIAEIARDRGDEPTLRWALDKLVQAQIPIQNIRRAILTGALLQEKSWRDYVAVLAALTAALADAKAAGPADTVTATRLAEAREAVRVFVRDHLAVASPLFTLGTQAVGLEARTPEEQATALLAKQDDLHKKLAELESAGRGKDPEAGQLRKQLIETTTALTQRPARPRESGRIIQRKILEYELDILEAKLRGDPKRAEVLENEVENLQRGTGAGGASREQKNAFARAFVVRADQLLKEGSLPESTRRVLQRRRREVGNLLVAPPKVEQAFEAVVSLRKMSFQAIEDVGRKSAPADTRPAGKDD